MLVYFLAFIYFSVTNAFYHNFSKKSIISSRSAVTSVYSLDSDTIQKLETLREKYARISNLASSESDAEKVQIEEIVQKYTLYKEIKSMMVKVRSMWKNEVSESRREKQVKSFSELFKGKAELEELLKQKLGLPFNKEVGPIPEVLAVQQIDQEIAQLQGKYDSVKFLLPEGKSTIDSRFS